MNSKEKITNSLRMVEKQRPTQALFCIIIINGLLIGNLVIVSVLLMYPMLNKIVFKRNRGIKFA